MKALNHRAKKKQASEKNNGAEINNSVCVSFSHNINTHTHTQSLSTEMLCLTLRGKISHSQFL